MHDQDFDNLATDSPRVIIVGRSALTRAGVRTLLAERGAAVLGASGSLAEVEALLADSDVLILLDPADLIPLSESGDATRLAVLLMGEIWPETPPAARAWGVVAPDAEPGALWAAVGALAAGLCVVPPSMLAARSRASVEILQDYAADESLTPRELAMLQLLAEGLTNRQIAARTSISEHTVKFHLSSIFSKLGVSSRTEAIRVGARRGLVVW